MVSALPAGSTCQLYFIQCKNIKEALVEWYISVILQSNWLAVLGLPANCFVNSTDNDLHHVHISYFMYVAWNNVLQPRFPCHCYVSILLVCGALGLIVLCFKNNIASTGSWTSGCHEWCFLSKAVENRTLWWGMQEVVTLVAGISELWPQPWDVTSWIYLSPTLCCNKTPYEIHCGSGMFCRCVPTYVRTCIVVWAGEVCTFFYVHT